MCPFVLCTLCSAQNQKINKLLLFLIYISDTSKLKFFLFADDTNLLYANKDLKTLENTVNTELIKLCDWLTSNKLTLNIKKSNFVLFRTWQKRITTPVNIRLFDSDTGQYVDLDNKECVKYLGVLIDSHLSWRNQIDYISTKLSKTIRLFAKLRHSVPQHTLITLYWSLIHPYLNYGIIAWGQASKTLLNKLLLLQKRVLRFIFFVNWRDSAIPLFVKANIPPLNIMYCQSVANLVYDVVNENCPKNILQLFLSIKDILSYRTLSAANGKLYTRPSRLKTQPNSFSRSGTRFWNSLPKSVKESPKFSFKNKIRNALFSMLQQEESYFEFERVTQVFEKYCASC